MTHPLSSPQNHPTRRCLSVPILFLCMGCASILTITSNESATPQDARLRKGDAGRWILSIPGAKGLDIQPCPNKDVILLGRADRFSIQRFSERGEKKWSLFAEGCGNAHMAVGGDDEIYLTIDGFLSVNDIPKPEQWDRRRFCPSGSTTRLPTTILRLNGRGALLWKKTILDDNSELIALLANTDVSVFVSRRTSSAPERSVTTTVTALTPDGKTAWHREVPGQATVASVSDSERLILGFENNGVDSPCMVLALSMTSGDRIWERRLTTVKGICRPKTLFTTDTDAVLTTQNTLGQEIMGLDTHTGTVRWTTPAAALDEITTPLQRPYRHETMAVVVSQRPSRSSLGAYDPCLVFVNPRNGAAHLFARLVSSVDNAAFDGAQLTAVRWSPDGLLLTGMFHGNIRFLDLHIDTRPTYDAQCRSIDPGYYLNGPPEFTPLTRRTLFGRPRVTCPNGAYEQRYRIYRSTLFAARLPYRPLSLE